MVDSLEDADAEGGAITGGVVPYAVRTGALADGDIAKLLVITAAGAWVDGGSVIELVDSKVIELGTPQYALEKSVLLILEQSSELVG
jgi:hypothetical protein